VSTHRRIGAALMALGVVVLLVAVVQTVSGDDETGQVAAENTVASRVTTTVPTATRQAPTTTVAPTTTMAPTTTVAPTTTAAPAVTTTTTVVVPTAAEAEAFVAAFAQAIAARDVEFLLASLHPLAVAQSDEASCRTLIEDEILLLENYRVTGDVSVEQRTISVGDETFEVDPFFIVPVTFTFQGQEFDQAANLGNFEGEVRWFTACG